MKKICFVTGTRADYGIMATVMKEIADSLKAQLQIVATNMHLSPQFGYTLNEIEADGFFVDKKIDSLVPGNSAEATVKSMARVQKGLAEAFTELKPDLVVILGDRYEALAAASAAVVFNIPVVHLHGGETTEGAIDDAFRHAITKLSTYHFAATPQYVDKIISMGEDPSRVFHSGAPGAEIRDYNPSPGEPSLDEKFYEKTGILPNEPFLLLAFHPVTLSPDKGTAELKATLDALDTFIEDGYKVLVTMPNSDPGNEEISEMLKDWRAEDPQNVVKVSSLGSVLFHHGMDRAAVMAGNSSAALIEAPSHRLGAANIGMRQKGRAHGLSVIDVPADKNRIVSALKALTSLEMKAVLMGVPISTLNPYYKPSSASFIAEKILSL